MANESKNLLNTINMTPGPRKIKSILTPSLRQAAGWVLFSLALMGCQRISPVRYAEFGNLPFEGLTPSQALEFKPFSTDSAEMLTERFDVVLVVRYTSRCPSRSIILDVEEISLEREIPDTTRVTVPLFDDRGKPLGRGNYGVFEVADTLKKGVRIPDGYTVSLSTPLSPSSTKGVDALGIILSRPDIKEYNLFNLFNFI